MLRVSVVDPFQLNANRYRSLLFILTASAALSASPGLTGSTDADAADQAKSKAEASATVTVTAEGQPVELSKTPNPVKVITREQIDRSGATNLATLLQSAFPGQLMSNGGVGTSTSFFLGGARSQDVVVLLDGIRLSDASGLGSVSPASVGLLGIERIEIQQGPCSTRFGAEAMGGVVALYSTGAGEGFSGLLKGAVGTRGISQEQAEVAYGNKQGSWIRAAVSGAKEDQATETVNPYRSNGAHIAFGFNLAETNALAFTYRNTYEGVPIPWVTTTFPRSYSDVRETTVRQEQFIGSLRSTFGTEWLLEVSLGQVLQHRQEPAYAAPYTPFSPYDSRRNQANASLSWLGSNSGATTSFTGYAEDGYTLGYPSGTNHGDGHHLALSQEAWYEPTSSVRITGGLRQQWDRQAFVVTSGPTPPSMDASSLTGKLGATWQIGQGFRAYAAFGTGFGLPLLSAVMWNQQGGGEQLQREKSRFVQVGGAWERGPWYAKVEANRISIENLVSFDFTSYLYQNSGAMRIQGAEGTFGYRQSTFFLEGFYRNQEARDTQAPKAQQLMTDSVVRRPFQTLGLKGSRTFGLWRGDLAWGWSGARYEYFGFGLPIRASKVHFNTLDMALAWKPIKPLELTLRGSHLMQKAWSVQDWTSGTLDGKNDAYLVAGFPAQPRSFSLEAAYRF
jgi:vitamin B12 transporter